MQRLHRQPAGDGGRGASPAATPGQARRAAHHRGPRGRRRRQDRGAVPQQPAASPSRSTSTSHARTQPTRSASTCCRATASFCGVGTPTDRRTTGRRSARVAAPCAVSSRPGCSTRAATPSRLGPMCTRATWHRQRRRRDLVRRGEGPSRVAVLLGQEPGAAGAAARLEHREDGCRRWPPTERGLTWTGTW